MEEDQRWPTNSSLAETAVGITVAPDEPVEEEAVLQELSMVFAIVMNLMCIAGMIGNSLSLYIFTRPSFRKRSINVLLSALSATDLCVCILAIPCFSISQLKVIVSAPLVASVMLYAYPITLMCQSMSVWLLVSITVDRYLAVCHPFIVRIYCTRTRALITIGLIVFFSIAYNFVRFWEWKLNDDAEGGSVEDLLVPLLRGNHMFMLLYQNIATLITQFVVPLLVLGFLNLEVAHTILKAGEQRRDLVASEKREHSTAKMMLFVVLVFIFCYTFSFTLNVAEILDEELFRGPLGFLLNDVNNILVVINSSSSFIFYTTYSTRYRSSLRTLPGIRLCAARCSCCFQGEQRRRRSGVSTGIGGGDGSTEYSTLNLSTKSPKRSVESTRYGNLLDVVKHSSRRTSLTPATHEMKATLSKDLNGRSL